MGHLINASHEGVGVALPRDTHHAGELRKRLPFVTGNFSAPLPHKSFVPHLESKKPLVVHARVDVSSHSEFWVLLSLDCFAPEPAAMFAEYAVERGWWSTSTEHSELILARDALDLIRIPAKASSPWLEAEMRAEATSSDGIQRVAWILDSEGNALPSDL